MEPALLDELLAHLQLPRTFARCVTSSPGHYSAYVSHEEQSGLVLPEAICRFRASSTAHGVDMVADFMVSTPALEHRQTVCYLRVHLANDEVTCVLLDSNKEPPFCDFHEIVEQRKKYLSTSPLSLLMLLLEFIGHGCDSLTSDLDTLLLDAESSTGFATEPNASIAASKYEQLNTEVHRCRLMLAALRLFTEYEQEFGQFLRNSVDLIDKLRVERGRGPEPGWKRSGTLQVLDHLLTASRRRQAYVEVLRDRIQLQTDVVSAAVSAHGSTRRS